MLRFYALLCLFLAACHSTQLPYRPIGSELFQNPAFAAWSKGTPLKRAFGKGAIEEQRGDFDAADHWVAKDTVFPTSYLIASKDPAGMKYEFHPAGPESFYARQYIGDPNWLYGKKIRLTATFECSNDVSRVWFYLHFRWNKNEEDKPGVTILSESGSIESGVHTADVQMPSGNPKYKLDVLAGFVPSLNMDTDVTGWCVIHSMSAKQIL